MQVADNCPGKTAESFCTEPLRISSHSCTSQLRSGANKAMHFLPHFFPCPPHCFNEFRIMHSVRAPFLIVLWNGWALPMHAIHSHDSQTGVNDYGAEFIAWNISSVLADGAIVLETLTGVPQRSIFLRKKWLQRLTPARLFERIVISSCSSVPRGVWGRRLIPIRRRRCSRMRLGNGGVLW